MKLLLPLLLLVALFVAGVLHLFKLRFETGDVYPAYSSLRADPIGTRALYESLEQLMPVRRHFQPLDHLGPGTNTVVFILGATPHQLALGLAELRGLERAVNEGAQLVLTFVPRTSAKRGRPPVPTPSGAPAPSGTRVNRIELLERWGAEWDMTALAGGEKVVTAQRSVTRPDLPGQLSCRTTLHFKNLTPAWTTIFERGTNLPVVIERRFGQGRIIACADAYWLSNEALFAERSTALLVWLVGPAGEAVFDEAHLGVTEQPGVATLMHRYHLHALVASLLLLAILFAWKNTASFLPAEEEGPDEIIRGRETTAGVINLLRRSVAPAELLRICLEEWKQHCAPRVPPARLRQLQAVVDEYNQTEPRQRNSIDTYRRLCRILQNK